MLELFNLVLVGKYLQMLAEIYLATSGIRTEIKGDSIMYYFLWVECQEKDSVKASLNTIKVEQLLHFS